MLFSAMFLSTSASISTVTSELPITTVSEDCEIETVDDGNCVHSIWIFYPNGDVEVFQDMSNC